MCSFPKLARAYSDLLSIPYPTIDLAGRHLRSADMITVKGFGRGGAVMTSRDAAALLLALLINHERGGNFVRKVKCVLELPMHEYLTNPKQYADDLSHRSAKTAGHGLALFIGDMLVPRVRERLERGDDIVTVNVDADGVFVSLSIFERSPGEIAQFVNTLYQRGERKRRDVERLTVVSGRVLLEIAKLLEA